MAFNLSSLAPITTTATTLSNLVLVSPQAVVGYQPQNFNNNSSFISNATAAQSFSSPALLFHYEGEQSVTLESDITDHYIEDNTAVQDQISIKPTVITTHGFIGELNDVAPIGNQIIQSLLSKLSLISSYTPALSITALNAYNQAFQAYQIALNAINAGVAAWASVNNLVGSGGFGENVVGNNGLTNAVTGANASTVYKLTQNRQQLAFQQFFAYQQSRTLFTVQTPWAIFQNMAILHLRAIQDAEFAQITDFEISFKQIRLASSLSLTNLTNNSVQGRLQQATQANTVVNTGPSSVGSLVSYTPSTNPVNSPTVVSA